MLRAQRRRDTVTEGGWAELSDELLSKVLELLQVAGQAGGLGFSQTSATVRLVCAAWKAVHDALVTRLVLRRQTTDEAMGMLVLRFPAVASLEVNDTEKVLDRRGMRAVSSCTDSLNLAELFRLQGKYEEALQVHAAYQRFVDRSSRVWHGETENDP